jgi:GNAT superfamily N-acetyltransferase
MRNHFPKSYLDAVVAGRPDEHDALVARNRTGNVIALGSLVTGERPAEIGLLVADAWQRHRVGSTLFELLLERARGNGVDLIVASVLTERRRVLELMRTQATPLHSALDHGVLTVVYRLHETIRPEGS